MQFLCWEGRDLEFPRESYFASLRFTRRLKAPMPARMGGRWEMGGEEVGEADPSLWGG